MDSQLFADIRKLSGLNQYEMADKLGVSRSLVAKIEIGDREVSTDIMARFNEMYGADKISLVAELSKAIRD